MTWIYPFEEYHRLAATGAEGQAEVFFGDWFVRSVINQGLPVATVGTPEAFDALLTKRERAPQTVAFLPTAAVRGEAGAKRLFAWLHQGIPAILYGPASPLHTSVLRYLDLELGSPLEGALVLKNADSAVVGNLLHDPISSAGGIAASVVGNRHTDHSIIVHYTITSVLEERAYSVSAYPEEPHN